MWGGGAPPVMAGSQLRHFSQSANNDYLYDDLVFMVMNHQIRRTDGEARHLTFVTYTGDARRDDFVFRLRGSAQIESRAIAVLAVQMDRDFTTDPQRQPGSVNRDVLRRIGTLNVDKNWF